MKQYMVDTVIINRILEYDLDLKYFKRPYKHIFTTHVQRDEILNTPDQILRNDLLSIFQEVDNPIATESALWDESKWDESKWGTDDLVGKILGELNKKKRKPSNRKDALIADTAIKNNFILVTEDQDLYDVVKEVFKGSVQKLEEYLKSS